MTDRTLYHDNPALAMSGPAELSIDALDEANGGLLALGWYIASKWGAAGVGYCVGSLAGFGVTVAAFLD